ncbi:MAG: hypothetical protein V4813_07630 [Gemmatimonadota bacterium]
MAILRLDQNVQHAAVVAQCRALDRWRRGITARAETGPQRKNRFYAQAVPSATWRTPLTRSTHDGIAETGMRLSHPMRLRTVDDSILPPTQRHNRLAFDS